jgi:ADP-heptose:LPS heptosyltransferase
MKLKLKQQIDLFFGYLFIVLNIIPAKILGMLLKRNHQVDNSPDVIVFIKMLGLGSVFMALDSIQSIKKRHANTKVVLICGRGVKPGVMPLGVFDEVVEINDRTFISLLRTSLNALIYCWRYKKIWIIDLEVYSKLSTIFSLWTLAQNRFGFYLNSVWFRFNLNTHNVFFNEFILLEENYKRMAEECGVNEFVQYQYPIQVDNNVPKKYIAINNTCSELGKERLASSDLIQSVILWILNNTTWEVVLLGAPHDQNDNQKFIINNFDEIQQLKIHNIAGKFSFEAYYSFLYLECKALVTIDTGPLHFARRLNVPTVSIWGPTHPKTRIQEDENNKVVFLNALCSPCVHMVDILPCGGDNFCMKNITSEQVTSKLKNII